VLPAPDESFEADVESMWHPDTPESESTHIEFILITLGKLLNHAAHSELN